MYSVKLSKHSFTHLCKTFGILILCFSFTACSKPSRYTLKNDTGPDQDINHHNVKNAVPQAEPKSRGGNKNYRVRGKNYRVLNSSKGYKKRGIASWYGKKFHGHRTSNGEVYDMYKMSAAHKTLPLPTFVRVTHLKNGRSVILRVNDRGPFHRNRLIDLSYVAAKKLGITATGTGVVEVEAIDIKSYRAKKYTSHTAQFNRNTSKAGRFENHPATEKADFKIYLQAGAFTQRQNAQALRNKIIRLSLSVDSNIKFDPNQRLFKVRLGPFNNVETADNASEKLLQYQIDNSYIVVD